MYLLKKDIEFLFSSSRFRIAKQILVLALSFSIIGCDSPSATPIVVQNSPALAMQEVKQNNSPMKIINDIQRSGIEIGYFGNSIPNSNIEMLFTYPEKFGEFGSEEFLQNSENEIRRVIFEKKTPIITLEIFKDTTRDTLTEILSGSLDMKIRNYFVMLSKYPEIILRPMHEMDTTQTRYPWSGNDPERYIEAWRHLFEINKTLNDSTKFLWSPAGASSATNYFPGEKYVDFVGFSLYDYPDEIETAWYGGPVDLVTDFSRKMEMMPKGIPIIIPEIGISGDSPAQKSNILEAIYQTLIAKFPSRIKAIIFFNSKETLKGYESVSFELN